MVVPNMLAAELNLWEQYKNAKDGQIREKLIIHYLPLVKNIAGRLAIALPAVVQRDDLIGYGIFGLIDAIDKFDLERGFKFETYAYIRVKGAILDGLRIMDWVSPNLRQKAKELEGAYHQLENQLGRSATDEEIAQTMGITLPQLHQLLLETGCLSLYSLDETLATGADTQLSLGQQLIDHSSPNPVSHAEEEEEKLILTSSIEKLPEKEKLVLSLYYYEELTLKEIGEVMGLSESRISQLHTKAIMRLRGSLSRVKKKIGW